MNEKDFFFLHSYDL